MACEEVPRCWITHVQFSPVDPDLLLYNHEWAADCGIRRLWLWDGEEHHRLRDEGSGRSAADWASHEMWERDGEGILYHGRYRNGPAFLGRVRPDGKGRVEIALPKDWVGYGHFTEGQPGVLVSDGYYLSPGEPPTKKGRWISNISVDWERGRADWRGLCHHGSSWDSQDSHPHPVFDHAGEWIYFTSDKDGRRAIYRIRA